MTTYYHGSDQQIATITGAICLTTSWAAAEDYALRKDGEIAEVGYIHTITITTGLDIADTETLRQVAAEVLGSLDLYDCDYELADQQRVRDALAARGYAGVEYEDQTITGRAHDCVLIWHTDSLTIDGVEMVEA